MCGEVGVKDYKLDQSCKGKSPQASIRSEGMVKKMHQTGYDKDEIIII